MFEQEKMEWLKSIRAVKLPEPAIYIYTIPGHDGFYLLSERGIRERTVEELQAQYEETKQQLGLSSEVEDKRCVCVRVMDAVAN